MITSSALKCGFSGGVLIDFPQSSKAKKYFLVLDAGVTCTMPKALGEDDAINSNSSVKYNCERNNRKRSKYSKDTENPKDWILRKKELYRKRGYENIPADSKYTGRKRKTRF